MKREPSKKSPLGIPQLETLSEAYRKLAPYLSIGYVMVFSVVLLTFLGHYFDKKWHTEPWLTVTGAILGMAAGFYQFFKVVLSLSNEQNNKKKKDDF